MSEKKYTVSQLAEILGAELVGSGQACINCVLPFELACEGSVTFADEKLLKQIDKCKASAIIVSKKIESPTTLLVVDNVERALIAALKLFVVQPVSAAVGVHKSAIVEKGASVDATASIGPFVHIKSGAKIGRNTVIDSGCSIGADSVIGDNCRIESNVVVYYNCCIGNNCIVGSNCTIGSTGFGYYFIDGAHQLIPHTGGVVIEDCVEMGANCCIDRAKFGNTIIGAGTKIDNLVHIAHNVVIGKCCLLAGCVAIAGSTTVGNGVVMAGQVGVKDHAVIGDGTQIGAQAGVATDIAAGQKVVGSPAINAREKLKQVLAAQKLPAMQKKLKEITKRIETLEAAKDNS